VAVVEIPGLVLSLALVLAAAKAGGYLAGKAHLPPVLGELGAGLLLGNLALAGVSRLDYLKTDPGIDLAARIAVILLLFHASVESTIGEMRRLGGPALLIALTGIAGSFAATWTVARLLLPDAAPLAQVFAAASLSATSVGVTARVFRDLGCAKSSSAHLILAAAVFDDVFALLILAVLGATGAIPVVLLKAAIFLVGGLAIGAFVSPRLLSVASRSMAIVLLTAALAFCFAMAWLSSLFGLAPIIGAFAAGVAVEEWHYKDFITRKEKTLDDLITPLASWVVPIFFVTIGIRTELSGLARPRVVMLAAALTAAALIGKQLCALGARSASATVDRIAVGLGMMPRGEVTLIFANLGLTLVAAGRPLVSADTFLALVVTVIATTIVTPVALKWRLSTARRRS